MKMACMFLATLGVLIQLNAAACVMEKADTGALRAHTLFTTTKISYLTCGEKRVGSNNPYAIKISDLNKFTKKFRKIGSDSYSSLSKAMRNFDDDKGYNTVFSSLAISKMTKSNGYHDPEVCQHIHENLVKMLGSNFSDSDFHALASTDEFNLNLIDEASKAVCN